MATSKIVTARISQIERLRLEALSSRCGRGVSTLVADAIRQLLDKEAPEVAHLQHLHLSAKNPALVVRQVGIFRLSA